MLAEALAFSAAVDAMRGRRLDDGKLARALALEDPDRQVVVPLDADLPNAIEALVALGELQ